MTTLDMLPTFSVSELHNLIDGLRRHRSTDPDMRLILKRAVAQLKITKNR